MLVVFSITLYGKSHDSQFVTDDVVKLTELNDAPNLQLPSNPKVRISPCSSKTLTAGAHRLLTARASFIY